jgi:hypothetical protein
VGGRGGTEPYGGGVIHAFYIIIYASYRDSFIVICIDIALFALFIRFRGLYYKSLVFVFDLSQAENILFIFLYFRDLHGLK